MKKHLRMIAGIILHPVKIMCHWFYRQNDEWTIQKAIRWNWYRKNHERMHWIGNPVDFPTALNRSVSELEDNLYRGAI